MNDLATIDARARIDRIKSHVTAAWDDIITAYRERDWLALGYATWYDLCEREFGGARIALPLDDRREVVAELTGAGMSTRAIGAALGVDHKTVVNDRNATGESSSVAEPLRRCIQCGALVYLSQRCRYIGILHPAPDYTRHEES